MTAPRLACASLMLAASVSACTEPLPPESASAASDQPVDEAIAPGDAPAPASDTLVVSISRDAMFVETLVPRFESALGIDVTLVHAWEGDQDLDPLAEGAASDVDVIVVNDFYQLAALADQERLRPLPDAVADEVETGWRDADGEWIALGARLFSVAYRSDRFGADDVPTSLAALAGEPWHGRIGWAPGDTSFAPFTAALVAATNEDVARERLEAFRDNGASTWDIGELANMLISGQVDVAIGPHDAFARTERLTVTPLTDIAPAVLAQSSAVGVVRTTDRYDEASAFVGWLVGADAQQVLSTTTFQIPMSQRTAPSPTLPTVADLRPDHMNGSAPQAPALAEHILRDLIVSP